MKVIIYLWKAELNIILRIDMVLLEFFLSFLLSCSFWLFHLCLEFIFNFLQNHSESPLAITETKDFEKGLAPQENKKLFALD